MSPFKKKFHSFFKVCYYNVIKFAPYEFKCSVLNIEQLSNRSKNARILFVFDVLTGQIDSPKLLSFLEINAPVRLLRNHSFIRIPNRRTNYASFEPVLTMSSLFNEVYYLFNFLGYLVILLKTISVTSIEERSSRVILCFYLNFISIRYSSIRS